MSKIGKIFLWIALVGALVAAGAGIKLISTYNDTKENLRVTTQQKLEDDKQVAKDKIAYAQLNAAKTESDKNLSDATAKVTDLTNQMATAKQQVADATAATQKATDAEKTAQDAYDAIKKTLNGRTAEEIVAAEAKAQSDLATAQSEKKILEDQLQASQTHVTDLQDSLKRSKVGTMPPGISGKVTFVDHTWNFVVLDVGLNSGIVPNGELIVYRGRSFLGKVRITKADENDSVAEILPDVKGDIQIGDSVLN